MNGRLWAWSILGVLAAAYATVGLVVAPEDAKLSSHGSGWDDVSGLREGLEAQNLQTATMFTSPLALKDDARTVFVALGIERPYTAQETERLVRFWQEGGHLLIADQGPHMAGLAGRFGVDVVPQQVFDPRFSGDGTRLVSAVGDVDGRTYALLANDPLQLAAGAERPWEVLARTSDDTFVDSDEDGQAGLGDRKGAVPLVLRHKGEAGGTVVLASQPGLFADLFTRPQNHGVHERLEETGYDEPVQNFDFALDVLLSMLPTGGTVVFDESRHAQTEPAQTFTRVMRPVVMLTADDQAAAHLGGTSQDIPALPLFVVALAAGGAVLVTRVPAASDWLHRHHLRHVAPPASLRDGGASALERLIWEHVRQRHNLSLVEFDHLGPEQRLALVDPFLKPFLEDRRDKPSREEVLRHLENALQIQEVATI